MEPVGRSVGETGAGDALSGIGKGGSQWRKTGRSGFKAKPDKDFQDVRGDRFSLCRKSDPVVGGKCKSDICYVFAKPEQPD